MRVQMALRETSDLDLHGDGSWKQAGESPATMKRPRHPRWLIV